MTPHPNNVQSLLDSLPTVEASVNAADQSYDWPDVRYSTKAERKGSLWKIHHQLQGAPGILQLLDSGMASYAVEVRCNKTMTVNTFPKLDEISPDPITTVAISDDCVFQRYWLIPGVVATAHCQLDTTDSLWESEGPLQVHSGRWLVRGAPYEAHGKGFGFLVFLPNPDIEPETRLTINPENRGEDIQFVIMGRPNILEHLKRADPTAWLYCWATIFAMFPQVPEFNISYEDGTPKIPDSAIATKLALKLKEAGLELWMDDSHEVPREWNPLAAASVMNPLSSDFFAEEFDE